MQVMALYASMRIYACPIRYIMLSRCIIVTGYASSPRAGQRWACTPWCSSSRARGPATRTCRSARAADRGAATRTVDYPRHQRATRRAPPGCLPRRPLGEYPSLPGGQSPRMARCSGRVRVTGFCGTPKILRRVGLSLTPPPARVRAFLRGPEKSVRAGWGHPNNLRGVPQADSPARPQSGASPSRGEGGVARVKEVSASPGAVAPAHECAPPRYGNRDQGGAK